MELLSLFQRSKNMEKAARTETRKRYQNRDDLRQCYAGTSLRHSAYTRPVPGRLGLTISMVRKNKQQSRFNSTITPLNNTFFSFADKMISDENQNTYL